MALFRLRRRSEPKAWDFQSGLPYADALFGTALRLTRNRQDAEDLLQDTLLRAGRLAHTVGLRLPLAEIASAHDRVEQGAVLGNVVLDIP